VSSHCTKKCIFKEVNNFVNRSVWFWSLLMTLINAAWLLSNEAALIVKVKEEAESNRLLRHFFLKWAQLEMRSAFESQNSSWLQKLNCYVWQPDSFLLYISQPQEQRFYIFVNETASSTLLF